MVQVLRHIHHRDQVHVLVVQVTLTPVKVHLTHVATADIIENYLCYDLKYIVFFMILFLFLFCYHLLV